MMELGLTFPLQRFLRRQPPPCGDAADLGRCWDLHVISLGGQHSLLAVHSLTRYAFVRFRVPPLLWADLAGLFREGLQESLCAAGFSPPAIDAYLRQGQPMTFTRTHGRRPVAFLNRAWEDVLALDLCLDPDRQAQPLLDHAVNCRPCRCAGEDGLGTGAERMERFLAGKFPFETQGSSGRPSAPGRK